MILDGFPLAAGWPEEPDDDAANPEEPGWGLVGPNRALRSIEFAACDERPEQPLHTDRLRADWSGAEDARARQLSTYQDAGTAASAVTAIVDLYRECPRDERSSGHTFTHRLRPLDAGDQAWEIRTDVPPGQVASPYRLVTVLVRVGSAVYVEDRGGSRLTDTETVLADAAEPLAALCRFTRAGC